MTDENQLNWGNVVDTNDDGVVSEKELDTALDGLAEVEVENQSEVESDGYDTQAENEEELIEFPTVKSLSEIVPPSTNEHDLYHRQEWASICQKFADANDCHFLGFGIKDGEPMFKEIK